LRQKFFALTAALMLGSFTFAKLRRDSTKDKDSSAPHVMLTPGEIKWQPMPHEWAVGPPPPGFKLKAEIAIVQGDPTKEGALFVIRMRSPAGAQVPPHWHTVDENITVLSGIFCVGIGDKFDENACQDMTAGSYMVLPKGMHHFAVAKDDVIQIHGIGPFQIHWVK